MIFNSSSFEAINVTKTYKTVLLSGVTKVVTRPEALKEAKRQEVTPNNSRKSPFLLGPMKVSFKTRTTKRRHWRRVVRKNLQTKSMRLKKETILKVDACSCCGGLHYIEDCHEYDGTQQLSRIDYIRLSHMQGGLPGGIKKYKPKSEPYKKKTTSANSRESDRITKKKQTFRKKAQITEIISSQSQNEESKTKAVDDAAKETEQLQREEAEVQRINKLKEQVIVTNAEVTESMPETITWVESRPLLLRYRVAIMVGTGVVALLSVYVCYRAFKDRFVDVFERVTKNPQTLSLIKTLITGSVTAGITGMFYKLWNAISTIAPAIQHTYVRDAESLWEHENDIDDVRSDNASRGDLKHLAMVPVSYRHHEDVIDAYRILSGKHRQIWCSAELYTQTMNMFNTPTDLQPQTVYQRLHRALSTNTSVNVNRYHNAKYRIDRNTLDLGYARYMEDFQASRQDFCPDPNPLRSW